MGVAGQVIIGRFGDEISAHLVRHRLESEGIDTWIVDENMASVYPLYNQAIGGVKVAVRESEAAIATEILRDMESPVEVEVPVCPACGSSHVVDNPITYRWAVLLTLATFGLYLPVFHRRKRCEDCGRKW